MGLIIGIIATAMETGKADEGNKKEREERVLDNASMLLNIDRKMAVSKRVIESKVQPFREVFMLLDVKNEGKITREAIKNILPLLPFVTNVGSNFSLKSAPCLVVIFPL